MAKATCNKNTRFTRKIDLLETRKSLHFEHSFVRMVLKLGHVIKYIRNALKVLKCDAGEEWR